MMSQYKGNTFTRGVLSKALDKYIYCSLYSGENINWQETVLAFEEIKYFSTIEVRELKLILGLFNCFPDCLQFIKTTTKGFSEIKKCLLILKRKLPILKRMLSVVQKIDHPLFKAVLMDCIYEYNQCMKSEDIKQNIKQYPQEIVENYYQYCFVDQKIETLNSLFLFKYFPRLLNFSFQFNNKDISSKIENTVVDLICNTSTSNACLLNILYVELEAQKKFPHNQKKAIILADKFKQFVQYYSEQQEWDKAEGYVRHAEHYYKKAKKDLETNEMLSLKADIFIERGRQCDEQGEQWVSVSYWYKHALELYKTISSKYRETFGIVEKIKSVETLIFQSKPLMTVSLQNSIKIELPLPSKLEVYGRIDGKNFIEALQLLLTYTDQLDSDMPKSDLDIIARKKIITPDLLIQNDSNNSMSLLGLIDSTGHIINRYRFVIQEKYPKTEEDFLNLVQLSSIVPPVDLSLYAKALYLGYIGQLYPAVYLLAPKIENLFRIFLNNKGVTVLKTDRDGNETYVVLDKLLDEAQKQGGFDSKFINVLRQIFTQRGGAQIRHRVAHGLLNDGDSEGVLAYAWALGLKILLLSIDQDK